MTLGNILGGKYIQEGYLGTQSLEHLCDEWIALYMDGPNDQLWATKAMGNEQIASCVYAP